MRKAFHYWSNVCLSRELTNTLCLLTSQLCRLGFSLLLQVFLSYPDAVFFFYDNWGKLAVVGLSKKETSLIFPTPTHCWVKKYLHLTRLISPAIWRLCWSLSFHCSLRLLRKIKAIADGSANCSSGHWVNILGSTAANHSKSSPFNGKLLPNQPSQKGKHQTLDHESSCYPFNNE